MLIGGRVHGGRHLKASGTTANLLLAVLQMFGVEKETIGDSTGALSLA
jgi:hypothetical protein